MYMKPQQLILRCVAECENGQWQAICLDFNLAAQADSFDDVERKLKGMICEYVYDALQGEDHEYAAQFLTRKAPVGYWAKYYYVCFLHKYLRIRSDLSRFFNETLPLAPDSNCNHNV